MSLMKIWQVVALVAIPMGCASEGRYIAYEEARPVAATGGLVTLVDFLEGGRKAVRDHMQSRSEEERVEIEEMLERASAACTRLAIIAERSGLSYSQIDGSAVLVRPAGQERIRVATAGHTFSATNSEDVTVTLRDGRTMDTRLVDSSFVQFGSASGDWAILELAGSDESVSALSCRAPKSGELAFVLSYPNQMGVNEDGYVVFGNAYSNAPLAPIVTITEVKDTSPLILKPIAGSLPLGGASGGAIVNRAGELIGVLSGTGWNPKRRGADYWIEGASVLAFLEQLSVQSERN